MSSETRLTPGSYIIEQLQDLVLDSSDVEELLNELTRLSASTFSQPGHEVLCGITLQRKKKATTVASSDARAQSMDEVQYEFGDGPCLAAIRNGETTHVPDLEAEHRWPDYVQAVMERGIRSILGVPFALEGDAAAGLNLYAPDAHAFSGEDIELAEMYARQASKALLLAVRIAHLSDARNDLSSALQSRTVIDLAVGIIMGQNRCSQDAAFGVLKNASSARNMKLRDVAAAVVESVSKSTDVTTHFDA